MYKIGNTLDDDDDEARSESEDVYRTKFCPVKELNRRFVNNEEIIGRMMTFDPKNE